VNTVMNLRVPYKAGNFLTSWVTVTNVLKFSIIVYLPVLN
jgi:hypothetical protein